MKRRNFILLATAGAAAVALPVGYHYLKRRAVNPALANPESLSLIMEPDSIQSIGRRYRALVPEEHGEVALIDLLSAETVGTTALQADLNERTISDFKEGDTVIVDGWILSRTEARQCALLSALN